MPIKYSSYNSAPLNQKIKATQILVRPNIDLTSMIQSFSKLQTELSHLDKEIIEQGETQIKYDVYLTKERELVERMSQLEDLLIPDSFDYNRITSLSAEAKQKFTKIKPRTLGQASRISGVNPSDIQILMVFMGR